MIDYAGAVAFACRRWDGPAGGFRDVEDVRVAHERFLRACPREVMLALVVRPEHFGVGERVDPSLAVCEIKRRPVEEAIRRENMHGHKLDREYEE